MRHPMDVNNEKYFIALSHVRPSRGISVFQITPVPLQGRVQLGSLHTAAKHVGAHGRAGLSRDKRLEDKSSTAGRDSVLCTEESPQAAGLGTISYPTPGLHPCDALQSVSSWLSKEDFTLHM